MSNPPALPAPAAKTGNDGGDEKNRYRATLNLPKTSFPMKANLVQNEPASIKRWQGMKLYERVREASKGKPRYVFHDGPPYANGSIHLGHLLNKSLKDFVVRSRTMMGMDCPYVPGWDCHGLPIEHKVMLELMEAGKLDKLKNLPEDQRRMAVRRECQKYAEKYVKLHIEQMTRALTLADYEHPYLTMQPSFEGATLEVLASLMEQGLVYRALKPVHWSIANETALAEAELEYEDRDDISVYVDFEAEDAEAVYDAFGLAKAEYAEGAEFDAAGPESEEDPEDHDPDAQVEEPVTKSAAPAPGTRPGVRPSFMIWTTTPWTLPANLAIAVNPKFEYALVFVDGNVTVMATALVETVTKAAKAEDVVVIAKTRGERLVGLRYKHPFVTREREGAMFSLLPADYVTLEDGTGLVHTAPGHGAEDFDTGRKNGLPVYCPVRENGAYDASVPDWLRGKDIWKANPEIVEHLRNSGHLFFSHTFTHSYPHDWRSKTPVIFRCTEQWFIGVDTPTKRDGRSLRETALAFVEPSANAASNETVHFVPEWGRNRMRGMLESRPDWCISRQRAWGLPIPAFFWRESTNRAGSGGTGLPTRATGSDAKRTGQETGATQSGTTQSGATKTDATHVLMTPASVRAVAKLVREKGADVWFQSEPAELLKYWDPTKDEHLPNWWKDRSLTVAALKETKKGPDILDVWFESGSTWNAVMRERSGGADFPCDLYLEGADQHRGWFQSSLLPSLGMMGRPPYRTLLTHGFTVDKDGRKLSKSSGDTIEALYANYGVDVLRWWVAGQSYENDMKVDREFFDLAGESYRKVRNTLRFMLSNLDDAPKSDGASSEGAASPTSLEAWVLAHFDALSARVLDSYERFDFQSAQKAIYDFCNDTLSATYLAAVKDRLYCDHADSPRRRATQDTLVKLTGGLSRLLAPLLPHTSDEAYRALHKVDPKDATTCVHVQEFVRTNGTPGYGARAHQAWSEALAAREAALAAMERAKATLGVENPLDMGVTIADPNGTLAAFDPIDLADLLGVSRVSLDRSAAEPKVIDLRNEPRCERSWKRDGTVKKRSDGGMLSDRDAAAVGVQ
jgi:isoleucyl-tRNA synthetase